LTDLYIQNLKYSGKENEFQGKVTGDIDITIADKSNIPENGTVTINITRGTLQLGVINIPTPMGNLPLKTDIINIGLLNFNSDIVNRTAKIKKFTLESDELRCSFTGTITLEPILKNSRLDMKMTLDPQSKILDQHRDIVNAFSKNGPIIISIGGTAGRPVFKMDKNEN
jgi:type II secretion system protein N